MDFVNNFSQNLPGLELSSLVSIIGALALASLEWEVFLASPLFGYRIIPTSKDSNFFCYKFYNF